MLGWRDRLRRTFYELRVEGEGRGREAAALGWGVHWLHAVLRLPPVALLDHRLGAAAQSAQALSGGQYFEPAVLAVPALCRAADRRVVAAARSAQPDARRPSDTSPWTFGADVLVGSVAVGAVLGVCVAAATLTTGGVRPVDRSFALLWQRASDRRTLQPGVTPGSSRAGNCAATRCIARFSNPACLPPAQPSSISDAAGGWRYRPFAKPLEPGSPRRSAAVRSAGGCRTARACGRGRPAGPWRGRGHRCLRRPRFRVADVQHRAVARRAAHDAARGAGRADRTRDLQTRARGGRLSSVKPMPRAAPAFCSSERATV